MCGTLGEYFRGQINLYSGIWRSYCEKPTYKQRSDSAARWRVVLAERRAGDQRETPCGWNIENNGNVTRHGSAEVSRSQITQALCDLLEFELYLRAVGSYWRILNRQWLGHFFSFLNGSEGEGMPENVWKADGVIWVRDNWGLKGWKWEWRKWNYLRNI